MKRKAFTLLVVVLLLCALWSSKNSTSANAESSKLNFATAVLGCTDAAMESCNDKAVKVKNDCEFRNQGGITEYTSCRCQSIRSAESCYRAAGCLIGANVFRQASPECFLSSGGGGGVDDGCGLTLDGGYSNTCECNPSDPSCASPVLIDVAGNGYRLTNVQNGVKFDIRATGAAIPVAWVEQGSDDAWLALDRNGNGAIDDGAELFGNFTPQPNAPNKNGFLALAEYDKSSNGGNGDGLITAADPVFTSLRLWQDSNHNGISEAEELILLATESVQSIDLNYKETKRMDQYGNLFRYRAKINGSRSAWDVFLTHL